MPGPEYFALLAVEIATLWASSNIFLICNRELNDKRDQILGVSPQARTLEQRRHLLSHDWIPLWWLTLSLALGFGSAALVLAIALCAYWLTAVFGGLLSLHCFGVFLVWFVHGKHDLFAMNRHLDDSAPS